MGRKDRAVVSDDVPSPDYVRPRLALDPPQEPTMNDLDLAAAAGGRAHLSRTDRATIDAEDAAAMIGHDGEPLDPDLLGRIRDAREVHGALAVANAACYLDFPESEWDEQHRIHQAIGLRPADGLYRLDVPIREPQILLLWGDETITTVRDSDRYENIGEHVTPLQRQMMVLRLRHLARLIEGTDAGPETDDHPSY